MRRASCTRPTPPQSSPSHGQAGHRSRVSRSRAQPQLPGDRGAHPGLVARGWHVRALGRGATRDQARRLGQRVRVLRRPALRQWAAALRAPPDRLREGHRAALPDDARPARRAALRLGLSRPAGRARGRERARHQRPPPDPGDGGRAVQPGLPGLGDEVHRRVGVLRHPHGALGRLRERLQDHAAGLHGERSVGLQDSLGQGPDLRRVPRDALLVGHGDDRLELRDAHGQRVPRAPGPGRHGALRASRHGGPTR